MKPTDPTPAEIHLACLQVRSTWTPDERLRRLRCDLRPMVRCADDRLVSVSAESYDAHSEHNERLIPCHR